MSRDHRPDLRTGAPHGGPATGAQPVPQTSRTFLPRQRLNEVLDEATSRPLTVIVAPAGAGKTSTLAEWATTVQQPMSWVNPSRHDPADTLLLLQEALRTSSDTAGGTPPTLVVIDDAHRLPTAARPILDDWLLTQPPDRVRIVLASRRDVPLPLVPLELRDAVTVLRAGALRFTDPEARALVARHAPDVSDADVDAVQERAQGWAAALVLGARAIGRAADRGQARLDLARTEQSVLDYLLGEVLSTLPAPTRHVLTCTVDSDDITSAEATVLSGDPRAPDRLADLAADGLLVAAYRDNAGQPFWRTHPMLREALRRQVALEGPDHALVTAAHRRAALHHAAHGPVRDAVAHATAAGAHALVAALLTDAGTTLIAGGDEQLVIRALGTLPPETMERHPALLGVTALAHRGVGDIETATRYAAATARAADAVRRRLADAPAQQPSGGELVMLTDACLLEAWQARFGWTDVGAAIARCRGLVGCADENGPTTAVDVRHIPHQPAWSLPTSRVPWLLNELAAAELWTSQLDLAEVHTGEALVSAEAQGQHRVLAAINANRAVIALFRGQVPDAEAAAGASHQAAARAGRRDDSLLARAHVVDAFVAAADLRYDDVTAALDDVRRISARATDPLVAILLDLMQARLLMDRGKLDAAQAVISARPTVPDAVPDNLVRLLALTRLQLALLRGDGQAARQQAELMGDRGWAEGAALATAILTDRAGDRAAAARALDALLAADPAPGNAMTGAIASAYRVTLLLREGSPRLVRAAVHDMLGRVVPGRLFGALVFTGPDPALHESLRQEVGGSRPHPYAAEALAALDRHALYGGAPGPRPRRPTRGPAGSLTPPAAHLPAGAPL